MPESTLIHVSDNWREVAAVVDRYEDALGSALREGNSSQPPWPDVRAFLDTVSEPNRRAALVAMLQVEQEHLWKSRQGMIVEEYQSRFPDLLADRGAVMELLRSEVGVRCRTGDTDLRSGFSSRFPDLELECAEETSTPHATNRCKDCLVPKPHIGKYVVECRLGSGSFGVVYRCRHVELNRLVAIKVTRDASRRTDLFLQEAQNVAALSHPNIVGLLDYGKLDDGRPYIVYEYIAGGTLAERIPARASAAAEADKRKPPSGVPPLPVSEGVQLIATLAEALHYAHTHGFVHRDLKPANILIDAQLRPYLADFGLALRDEDVGRREKEVGTPVYMSPEQARSESHLVDGRSDIFSLGVVFYELLTGTRPFRGESTAEILERIRSLDPRPPRQIDSGVPKELERICLKALAKRATDRYNTAQDMADDLRAFLAEAPEAPRSRDVDARPVRVAPPADNVDTKPGSATGGSAGKASDSATSARIVPKGLRSFDQADADFFLSLLPGPHDRHGLPESIRFWKNRIEDADPQNAFRAAIIYGPSGCGKSSLVKAGLLPLLDPSIIKVYIEASGDETEARLLRNLRRQLPGLGESGSLVRALTALRRGSGLAPGDKVLLVIDQFEQWLHAHGADEGAELVLALRQCDGLHVQCLLMVRDDFWLALSRFMQTLEVRVIEGQNSRLVDLFDLRHARKVLAAMGAAYGALPESARSREQESFLDQAVAELSDGGKVVSVRLALFGEMVKGKAWTPATLRDLGGADGVGVAFLDETFSSPTAPPHHRLHQRTAQAVLAALLPEIETDIKGQMRSREELVEAAGCSPTLRFDEVLAILDDELRLVTPADPECLDDPGDRSPAAARGKRYQLTHDYLVPSLRTWLTRKQKATRQGRAELRLADVAALWSARPERRRLPSLLEYLQVRLYTSPGAWSAGQRKMMCAAARFHAARLLAALVLVAAIAVASFELHGRWKARELRDRLFSAELDKVPAIVGEMANYRRWTDPLLRKDCDDAEARGDEAQRLRASLALLPADANQIDFLYDRLLRAGPDEIGALRVSLLPYREQIAGRLWDVVHARPSEQHVLAAAASLAHFSSDDPRWDAAAPGVAAVLVRVSPFFARSWTEELAPVRDRLLEPLSRIARDAAFGPNERLNATNILATSVPARPELLTMVLIDGEQEQFEIVFPLLAKLGAAPLQLLDEELDRLDGANPGSADPERAAQRKARSALALLKLERPQSVWRLLKNAPDERVRSYLIHWSKTAGVDPQVVVRQWPLETDGGARCALLFLLGDSFEGDRNDPRRKAMTQQLLSVYESDPDPQPHAAAQWLLEKWGQDNEIVRITDRLATEEAQRRVAGAYRQKRWYVNRERQTLTIINAVRPFLMGAPANEPDAEPIERQHRRTIGRRYAITATPVTELQFKHFLDSRQLGAKAAATECAAVNVAWYQAAEYCNWLSARDGIASDQWCYVPNAQGNFSSGMRAKDNYLALVGYRLPTEAEWEFACRAGTTTRFFCGQDEDLLRDYAWYQANSNGRRQPVARLLPNDFGLFDMHGNVWQWCEFAPPDYPRDSDVPFSDKESSEKVVMSSKPAAARGGAFNVLAGHTRAACRKLEPPNRSDKSLGFRVARTIPIDSQ